MGGSIPTFSLHFVLGTPVELAWRRRKRLAEDVSDNADAEAAPKDYSVLLRLRTGTPEELRQAVMVAQMSLGWAS